MNMSSREWSKFGFGVGHEKTSVSLFLGNCLDHLPTIPPVDMVLTSPPYDALRTYNDTCTWNFEIFQQVANALLRVVKPGGVIIWVVGDQTNNGDESGTSFRQALYFKEIGFRLHDTMLYRKINYLPMNHNRYEQEFEYMFCFSKGKPKTFNPIRIPCRFAGATNSGKSRYCYDGSRKMDRTSRVIQEKKLHGNIFEYHIGVMNETRHYNHPAMFPLALARDMIATWSNKGDTVLDCFMGSGTTGVACQEYGRQFIGMELVPEYFGMAQERLG